MESKYPKVEIDFLRIGRLPYFALYEIMEFLFGLEIDFLKTRGGWVDQYHLQVSKTHGELMDWIFRDMKVGRLKEIPGADPKNTTFRASEILKWLIDRKIIQWIVDQGIQVPLETMKFFDFKPPVSPSDGGNKKTGHPAPTTPKAKSMALKQEAHAIYKSIRAQQGRVFAIDILGHSAWWAALVKSGYKGDYELNMKRLQKWVGDFRKLEKPADFQK